MLNRVRVLQQIPRRHFSSTLKLSSPKKWPAFLTEDVPSDTTALALRTACGRKPYGPKVIQSLPQLESLEFQDIHMDTIGEDLLNALYSRPVQSIRFSNAKFDDQQSFSRFVGLFPQLTNLDCHQVTVKNSHRMPVVKHASVLHTVRSNQSPDIWRLFLNGSLGSDETLRKVTLNDVTYSDIPFVGLFLQRSSTTGMLQEFNVMHDHARQSAAVKHAWKKEPPVLDVSHVKRLGIDIHGRVRATCLRSPLEVVLQWWMKSLVPPGKESSLEYLKIVVGMNKGAIYIAQDAGNTWRALDSLLTDGRFPALRIVHVIIKVWKPTTLQKGERQKGLIQRSCPRLKRSKRLHVTIGHVKTKNNYFMDTHLF
ncbi:uncharacterized protein BT62DRAFT_720863 [Guyanagaster necrorhizus]|uniref:Uncharacterized protein n=1 Tax=Guyanagaster necrorhizus TaxID=856835 RepID=A0A9P7VW80_9AGAR|nr:uncharacterized protein BT62DRAFT_720863 [Guyanagaster necrorhizus MCA 3950]KAG7448666.1 hypothetical protein BT62DRAFT_720863 [Guyanagaster necrorhizus MCA 3950]